MIFIFSICSTGSYLRFYPLLRMCVHCWQISCVHKTIRNIIYYRPFYSTPLYYAVIYILYNIINIFMYKSLQCIHHAYAHQWARYYYCSIANIIIIYSIDLQYFLRFFEFNLFNWSLCEMQIVYILPRKMGKISDHSSKVQ